MCFQTDRIRIVLGIALAIACLLPAMACIHTPVGYTGQVKENTKEAFLFHDGTNAHLVVRTELETSGGLPATMAWVIPLPSLPSNYEVVGEQFFDEKAELQLKLYHPEAEGAVTAAHIVGGENSAIGVHGKHIVGDYEIQPVEILNVQAGGELNAWLSKKGFGTVPVENQRYYLTKGAVFLAIKLSGLSGAAVKLKPLHITYKANKLSLPLKCSSHSGIFDVTLYVFTDRRLDNGILYSSLLSWSRVS